tara:strand:+ start:2983 stop:3285 length:303 start_codon:yes stop_codon:yes gene_type:complete
MNKRIEKILDAVNDIKQVEIKPFFYTRLSSKLEYINNSEKFYLRYERPFLIMLVSFLLVLNIFFITSNETEGLNNLSVDINEFYFESNKNDIINFTSNEE